LELPGADRSRPVLSLRRAGELVSVKVTRADGAVALAEGTSEECARFAQAFTGLVLVPAVGPEKVFSTAQAAGRLRRGPDVMLPFVGPFLDWEEAEHAVGAIGGLIELGVGVYRALTGKDEDGEDAGPEVQVDPEQLGQVLQDHEDRLAKLERPARKKRRKPRS
jgi:hypothetical protein